MAFEDPRWRQMQAADQAGLVGIETDRGQVDLVAFALEQEIGARDRKLADPALAKAAADHDALGIGPGLQLEQARGHMRQFAGELTHVTSRLLKLRSEEHTS